MTVFFRCSLLGRTYRFELSRIHSGFNLFGALGDAYVATSTKALNMIGDPGLEQWLWTPERPRQVIENFRGPIVTNEGLACQGRRDEVLGVCISFIGSRPHFPG